MAALSQRCSELVPKMQWLQSFQNKIHRTGYCSGDVTANTLPSLPFPLDSHWNDIQDVHVFFSQQLMFKLSLSLFSFFFFLFCHFGFTAKNMPFILHCILTESNTIKAPSAGLINGRFCIGQPHMFSKQAEPPAGFVVFSIFQYCALRYVIDASWLS